MSVKRRDAAAILVSGSLLAIVLTSCSPTATGLSSSTKPGNPIITFPNSDDRLSNTVIMSNNEAEQAGVAGGALTVASVDVDQYVNDLTLDFHGNLGVRGTYHSLSSRKAKTAIAPYRGDAIEVLDRTTIVSYRYRGEPRGADPHLGIIAEDAPVPITDSRHRSFDLNNSIAITIAAERELASRVRTLQAEVASLRADRPRKAAPSARAAIPAKATNSSTHPIAAVRSTK